MFSGGGRRIRTYGGSPLNGFQDRRFRPLSQPTKTFYREAPGEVRALYRRAPMDQVRSIPTPLSVPLWDHYWPSARPVERRPLAMPLAVRTALPVP